MNSDNKRRDLRRDQRPKRRVRRKIRWGRVFLLLIFLAVLLTTAFWGAVWMYNNVIHPPKTPTVAADSKIGTDAKLNKRINVLLLGIDDGDSEAQESEPKRSDAMIVASFDPENNKVSLISLPRDTMVRLPGHKGYEKINAAYANGGVAMAKQTVANLLRIPIHYYAKLDWKGFIEVVDLLGGVDLYVDKDMYYEDPYADLTIDIKHGYQHLDGHKSGQYVRFRKDELGDIGRVQRQLKFMKALGLQFFSLENITKIPQILATINQHVETDMTTVTLLKAARSFNILSDNNIHSVMLYGDFYDSPTSGISYWKTDRKDIEKTLDEAEIPYMSAEEDPDAEDPVSGMDELPPSTNTEEGKREAIKKELEARKAREATALNKEVDEDGKSDRDSGKKAVKKSERPKKDRGADLGNVPRPVKKQ